jgi:hypothetical protein
MMGLNFRHYGYFHRILMKAKNIPFSLMFMAVPAEVMLKIHTQLFSTDILLHKAV